MKIQKLTNRSVLIETDHFPACAEETVKSAFESVGITASGEIEVTVFCGNDTVLLFAVCKEPVCVYRFETLENTIGGAQTLSHVCTSPSNFIYFDGAYFLTLPESREACHLSEFGNAEENPGILSAFLMEYGDVLCRGEAVKTISRVFHT